jgi:tRNA (cytidine/uridine-2'-O-)-methyltransferase
MRKWQMVSGSDAHAAKMESADMIRLALYEPDIPQNTGTMLRMAACLGVPVDIIEPAGFPVSDYAFRRAGMDYLDHVDITRHVSFAAFEEQRRAAGRRLLLLTTKASIPHLSAGFLRHDTLLMGRESVGVPDHIHEKADLRLRIPMKAGLRSFNVAISAALVIGEALRQLDAFP